jgi:hypothetical protein
MKKRPAQLSWPAAIPFEAFLYLLAGDFLQQFGLDQLAIEAGLFG